MIESPYDPDLDGYLSWLLAIDEIRKRMVIEGKVTPISEQERQWLREGKA